MDLIIGGAYQGKLAYAMERFHLTPEDRPAAKAALTPPAAVSAIWSRRSGPPFPPAELCHAPAATGCRGHGIV